MRLIHTSLNSSQNPSSDYTLKEDLAGDFGGCIVVSRNISWITLFNSTRIVIGENPASGVFGGPTFCGGRSIICSRQSNAIHDRRVQSS